MRLTLPEDELVRFVELDAPPRGKRQQVFVVDLVKRGVLLQKISDAIADDSSVQLALLGPVPRF